MRLNVHLLPWCQTQNAAKESGGGGVGGGGGGSRVGRRPQSQHIAQPPPTTAAATTNASTSSSRHHHQSQPSSSSAATTTATTTTTSATSHSTSQQYQHHQQQQHLATSLSSSTTTISTMSTTMAPLGPEPSDDPVRTDTQNVVDRSDSFWTSSIVSFEHGSCRLIEHVVRLCSECRRRCATARTATGFTYRVLSNFIDRCCLIRVCIVILIY